ncbi:MAG: endonuclease III [Candidatus Micrarchaeota archaeon]|nr:MAG: endonuclease III [Candidatus Micrarchaeota archaeon]
MPFKQLYSKLLSYFGFRDWWPGDSKLEICIGAILTQQTSWSNVERAIEKIKSNGYMNLERLAYLDISSLENLVRSTGFYKTKARYLQGFCKYVLEHYKSLDNLLSKPYEELRKELLGISGIGRETADSIILYASEQLSFVVDAYTKRVLKRVYGIEENDYEYIKALFESLIDKDLDLYKDFHAQIVELCKNICKSDPICSICPISSYCLYNRSELNTKKIKESH